MRTFFGEFFKDLFVHIIAPVCTLAMRGLVALLGFIVVAMAIGAGLAAGAWLAYKLISG